MEKEYIYPEVGDRTSPKEWNEQGRSDVVQRARKRVKEILSTHYPEHIPAGIDKEIRDRFDIKLTEAAMKPGNPRW